MIQRVMLNIKILISYITELERSKFLPYIPEFESSKAILFIFLAIFLECKPFCFFYFFKYLEKVTGICIRPEHIEKLKGQE